MANERPGSSASSERAPGDADGAEHDDATGHHDTDDDARRRGDTDDDARRRGDAVVTGDRTDDGRDNATDDHVDQPADDHDHASGRDVGWHLAAVAVVGRGRRELRHRGAAPMMTAERTADRR